MFGLQPAPLGAAPCVGLSVLELAAVGGPRHLLLNLQLGLRRLLRLLLALVVALALLPTPLRRFPLRFGITQSCCFRIAAAAALSLTRSSLALFALASTRSPILSSFVRTALSICNRKHHPDCR